MAKTTKVYLLNVPLENDYKHTIYFNNDDNNGRQRQFEYFSGKKIKSYEEFSYQRKEEIIRVPARFEEVLTCNYVMYQNPDFNNKWFYAFITDIKYIQSDRTDIYIETDVMQTWLFDYNLKSCFVEREHTDHDDIGANTLPEGLETGEYICDKTIDYLPLNKRGYVVGATVDLKQAFPTEDMTGLKFNSQYGTLYNGVYSGVRYFYYTNYADVQDKLTQVDKTGQGETISSIFMVPANFIGVVDTKGETIYGTLSGTVMTSVDPITKNWNDSTDDNGNVLESVKRPQTINGYTPKNKKLLTYPYCYILMDNNCGSSAMYQFEHFSGTPNFKLYFALTPGCSIRLIPLSYKNKAENDEEGLNGGKLPVCSWVTDVYTNWLTQNSLNIANQYESAIVQPMLNSALGIASGSMGTAISSTVSNFYSGYTQIQGILATKYQHSLQPPQSKGNINSGDVTFSKRKLTFTANVMTIKKEYAKCIDGYFSMYGYLVNRVKIPNANHREKYWYTKTIGCELDGSMPQSDLQKIKNCYDNGITFWNKSAAVGVYCDNNNELLDNAIK